MRSDLIQNSREICNPTIDKFELYTIVSTIADFNTNSFKIKICLDPRTSDV